MILIRLAEHRRAQGQNEHLVHLLVIEEAHRLLGHVPARGAEEAADPRGQAVETFSNLLSEVRAYGQGVVVADQVPVRLAPDVVKNTTLKVAHRSVSLDDRLALGGAMAMEPAQTVALTTLAVGEAVVFGSTDDAPLLLRIPRVKDLIAPLPPPDAMVQAHMSGWRADHRLTGSPRPFCVQTCADAPLECVAARRLAADARVQGTFAKLVLATIEEPGALDRGWGDWTGAVSARSPAGLNLNQLLRATAGHAADWFVHRRGAQGHWPYDATEDLGDLLRAVLLEKLDGHPEAATQEPRQAFRELASRLHARSFNPYPACEVVCTQSPRVCMYRSATESPSCSPGVAKIFGWAAGWLCSGHEHDGGGPWAGLFR
jgi:hypothetical protein